MKYRRSMATWNKIEANLSDKTFEEIAQLMGVTIGTIYNWARNGVPRYQNKNINAVIRENGSVPRSPAEAVKAISPKKVKKSTQDKYGDKLAFISLVSESDISDEAKLKIIGVITD